MDELLKIYYDGFKYGVVGTLIAMIKENEINKNYADQHIDSLEVEDKFKGIKYIYEEQKIKRGIK